MKYRITVIWIVLAALMLQFPSCACTEETGFQPEDLPEVCLWIDGGQEEIDRMNGSSDHSYRCTGTMDIIIPEGYAGESAAMYPQESVTGLRMKYIRGRGNGTWNMDKHPYKIKLEEKQDLFGMGKSKTWVLLANYFDNSLIRNRLTAWLGEQMGLEYTPQGLFVDLVMNGEYLGCYYLCEQVQISKNRVAIDALAGEELELPEIQGGYLLEFNPDDPENPDAFETARGQMFGNLDPSFDPEDGGWKNDVQKDYIRRFIQQAENAVYAEDGLAEDGRSYGEYIDLQSLADYWWIMEFTANGDAFRTDSAHFYKTRFEEDGSEGRLHFGPLWDFDESWGNAFTETIQVPGFNNTMFGWVDELRKKPEFRTLLRERWLVMDAKLEELVREGGVLDQTAAAVKNAWQRDYERWKDNRERSDMEFSRDFDAEIEHIRQWTILRRDWINGHLDRLGLLTCTLTVRGDGIEEKTYSIPCDTWTDLWLVEDGIAEGRIIAGWFYEDGTPAEDGFLMDRDITLTVQFAENE